MTDFTILLPVYNGEKYIERAILSILNQQYEKYKLYIINDGSTDMTLQICERITSGNENVEIINKPNGGLAESRNVAIRLAESRNIGTKVVWIDADDELAPGILNELNSIFMANPQCDAVCYDYDLIVDNKIVNNKYISQRFEKNGLIDGECFLQKVLIGDINNYMWAFAADIKCYNQISYPVGKNYEDLATLYKIANNVGTAYISYFKGYKYYIDNPNSLSKNFTVHDAWNLLDIIDEVDDYLDNRYKDYYSIFQAIYLINIIISLSDKSKNDTGEILSATIKRFSYVKRNLKYNCYKQSRYYYKIILMKLNLILPIYKIKGKLM